MNGLLMKILVPMVAACSIALLASGCVMGPPAEDGELVDDPMFGEETLFDEEGNPTATDSNGEPTRPLPALGAVPSAGKADRASGPGHETAGVPSEVEEEQPAQHCQGGESEFDPGPIQNNCDDSSGGGGVDHGSPQPLDPAPTPHDESASDED